jgi:hypothetical protein
MFFLAQRNNDWLQTLIPIAVFVIYTVANIIKANSDRKAKLPPRPPAPEPARRPTTPVDEQPRVLLEQDPLAQQQPSPAKTSPQQAELERLLRELGVPKSPASNTSRQAPPPPRIPPRRPARPPKVKGTGPTKSGRPESASPRASDRHLQSNLEKRHTDRTTSIVERHHLESNVEHRPQDSASAVDPALLLSRPTGNEQIRSMMRNQLRQSYMLAIVLGPPLGMRDDNASTEPLL